MYMCSSYVYARSQEKVKCQNNEREKEARNSDWTALCYVKYYVERRGHTEEELGAVEPQATRTQAKTKTRANVRKTQQRVGDQKRDGQTLLRVPLPVAHAHAHPPQQADQTLGTLVGRRLLEGRSIVIL